jgi:lysylphosphatidylglycerol synthetase-like protein (DUF2156 family)
MAHKRPRLNRPRRWVIVAVEVLVAAAAVVAAIVIWRSADTVIDFHLTDGRDLRSTRLLGNRAGLAVLLVLVAGVSLLDAVRQAVLASRVGPRRKERAELERYQRMEADERSTFSAG